GPAAPPERFRPPPPRRRPGSWSSPPDRRHACPHPHRASARGRLSQRAAYRVRKPQGGHPHLRGGVRHLLGAAGPADTGGRHAWRSSGELMRLFHRRPRMRRRPLVLICDVSGSMERYSRLLMIFAYAIARREDLEAFVFSTRLTRITRQLRQRDIEKALDAVSKGVHDFSGGTRIGEALADFN